MNKIVSYRVGVCRTFDLDDGKDLSEPYYKVYEFYDDGSVWLNMDFDDLEVARRYIEISLQHPTLDVWARLHKAEKEAE